MSFCCSKFFSFLIFDLLTLAYRTKSNSSEWHWCLDYPFDLTVLFSGISQFYFNMSCAFSCLSSSFWMECSCSSFWMECLSSFYLLLEILVPRASLRASEFKMSKTFSWIHSLPRNGFPYFKTIYLSVVFLLCKCHLVLWLLRVLIIRW